MVIAGLQGADTRSASGADRQAERPFPNIAEWIGKGRRPTPSPVRICGMSDVLITSDRDGVRELTLNRPEALNAFNQELWYATGDALDAAAVDDDVRCVLITGSGRAFSAGQDLGEMRQAVLLQPDIERSGHSRPHAQETMGAGGSVTCPEIQRH
jgi:hypothetical protein